MITALLAVLQISAAAPTLVVADAGRTTPVPLVNSASGPLVELERLAPVASIQVKRDDPATYTVTVGGVALRIESGSAMVRVGGQVRQLAAPAVVRDGKLFVPLQLLSDVIPQVVPNARWDASNHRLVLPPAPRSSAPNTPVKRTVVIDAGHGGRDPGTSGPAGARNRVLEKDVALDVSKLLGAALEARGVRVVYTRTTDTLVARFDRGRIANRAGGDLFISIHVNAANPRWSNPSAARGFETYFLAEARTEDAKRVEQMENQSIRYEDQPEAAPNDPLSFILGDMLQNEFLRESSEAAELIQRGMAKVHPGPDRGVKQAAFDVLVAAFMPSVLVELGFITNAAEAAYLSDRAKQRQLANAIADAAVEYLHRYDRRVNGVP